MACGDIVLEIFIDLKHPERVTNSETKGLGHIVFTVESLEEAMKIVEGEEIRIVWFSIKFTLTKDLDGQPIELKDKKLFSLKRGNK